MFDRLRWERVISAEAAALVAPPLAGVYIIGAVTTCANLPVTITWLYVGRSGNLQRRLSQHDPIAEVHPELREWMVSGRGHSETWYTVTEKDLAKQIEMHLIRELNPLLNRIKYTLKRAK
jgi:excinuclease UvrABC nuclease subunit